MGVRADVKHAAQGRTELANSTSAESKRIAPPGGCTGVAHDRHAASFGGVCLHDIPARFRSPPPIRADASAPVAHGSTEETPSSQPTTNASKRMTVNPVRHSQPKPPIKRQTRAESARRYKVRPRRWVRRRARRWKGSGVYSVASPAAHRNRIRPPPRTIWKADGSGWTAGPTGF
jgi:hypothetical protein